MFVDRCKEVVSVYFDEKIKNKMKELKKHGLIKPFDEEFYAQFEGMLYNMTPVDYYLKYMSMGKCYDASVVLGLAFGRGEDTYICRGNLKNAGLSMDGSTRFGHGWVERDGFVYDTTWQMILPQKEYYKLFGVKVYNKRTTKKFFEDCETMSDFHIHTKEYYEENYQPFAYASLIQMQNLGAMLSKNTADEEVRKRGEKLLVSLPDLEKVYAIYKKETDKFNYGENLAENI